MSKVYSIVQDRIIKEIEEAIKNGGTAPWHKPWKGGLPKNYITKKQYRGVNLLLLQQGGNYLTFKQIQDLHKKNPEIKLKKGSKSEIVVFWSFVEKQSENNEEENEKYPIFRYYNVFHESCVEGLEEEEEELFDNDPIEEAEKVVNAYKKECEINIQKSNRAYYVPSQDKIVCPILKQFNDAEFFYGVLFHEMIHSTGHKNRLGRFSETEQHIFGSESYSKEELIAEIGSSMLLSMIGIESKKQQENTTAYLYGWLSQIKKDVSLITTASQQAQKACDYILEFSNDSKSMFEITAGTAIPN